ncbi:hypothetical protein CC2G_000217 [Coprinopsis cinerea AmutBmut pab1-1]|nr:hypothetical protein CC2G_000217 [Coprinopsis cinerea AmutBmut pab1-1]
MADPDLLAFVRKPGVFTALQAEHDRAGWRVWASDLLLLVARQGCGSPVCSLNPHECHLSLDTMGCDACVDSLTRCPYVLDFITQRVREHTSLSGHALHAFIQSYEQWRLVALADNGPQDAIQRTRRALTLFDARAQSIRSITSSLPGQVDRLRSIVNDLRVCHFDLCANYTPLLHRWIHVSRTVRQVLDLLVEASSTLTNEGHPPALTNVTQVIDILRTSIQANSVYSDWPQQSLITSPLSLMGRMTPPSLSLHPMIQSHFDQDVLNTAPPTAPNYTSREVLHPNKSVHDYPDRPFPLVDGIPLTSSGAVGGFAFFAHECQRPLNPTFTSILVGKQPKWYMSVDRYSSPCSTEKAKPWMSGPARSMSSQMDSQARYSTLLLKRFVSATCLSDIRP